MEALYRRINGFSCHRSPVSGQTKLAKEIKAGATITESENVNQITSFKFDREPVCSILPLTISSCKWTFSLHFSILSYNHFSRESFLTFLIMRLIFWVIFVSLTGMLLVVGLGGLGVPCSSRDPRFASSNPTGVDGFFRT